MSMEENLELPSFDYSAPFTVSVEELNEAEKGSKFLQPGTYTAKITNVEYKGLPDGDKSFGKYLITYTAANEQSIKMMVLAPLTSKMGYGEKATKFPTNKTKSTLRAAGMKVATDAEFAQSLQAAFKEPAKSKLLSKESQITVGYKTPYVAYAGKDDGGASLFMIKNADGTEHEGFAGRTWTDRDTLAAEAADAQVKVAGFPEIVEVVAAVKSSSGSAKSSF